MPTYSPDKLRAASRQIFVAVGCPEPVARRVGDALVDANLVGHDSHGVIRIPQYVAAIRDGEIVPAAEPTVVRETAT